MSAKIYLAYINGYQPEWAERLPNRLRNCLPYSMDRLDVEFDLEMFYAPERSQYHSTLILAQLLKHLPDDDAKIIGITSVDLYIPVLTFVFGESQLDGNGAVISTYRLRNEFYGLPKDKELFLERTVKEALHELGHAFGLIHCPDYRCVMNSSTYVEDIDIKEAQLCETCQTKLGVNCE
ncbi:MAG: archaemetzincin family Zn-dependent metalloprotease [Candidatus Marinimicrobia bacterium]|nr:archaemetzincin family Zn-dependent metalloprotease [Candidatus Neomarinimicrobiota bacterium]MCF7827593.1 archaemetzincin family Zn-dependent metalloprotease [Candidatus Neomarinimicrobiota bacterium]MCF7881546.1 archaemetzincin family Zn-dependent metalloprotease [Candidatus Neomarinimicrobiota bacterium]